MSTSYLIYKATSPSGKSYVGVTNNFNRRKNTHLRKAREGSTLFFHAAIRKYGPENITWTILAVGMTECEAFELEKKLIEKLQLTNKEFGYNLQIGGKYFSWTPEIRARHKISVNTDSCKENRKVKFNAQLPEISKVISDKARKHSLGLNKPFYAYKPDEDLLITFNALFEVEERLSLLPKSVHIGLLGKTSYYKGYVFRYVSQVDDVEAFKAEAKELIATRFERYALSRAKASGIKATNIGTGEIKTYKYIGDFQKEVDGNRGVIISVLSGVKSSYKGWYLEYIRI
jgi:predicted GIY-YIG superfamily endonuclease